MAVLRVSGARPIGDAKRTVVPRGLSWLSYREATRIMRLLEIRYFEANNIVFSSSAYPNKIHVLLSGAASVIHEDRNKLVAILPPGIIPEFEPLAHLDHHFRFEALTNCVIGTLSWESFMGIDANLSMSSLRRFIQQNSIQFSKVLVRATGFFEMSLHDRLIVTFLQLADDLGVPDSRGRLIPLNLNHQALADLACGSRPKVTQHLAELEREQIVLRVGRRFIVKIQEFASKNPTSGKLLRIRDHLFSRN
jgi:CRP/FNR family transcriptional regulator, cyclic AMP receptor protein